LDQYNGKQKNTNSTWANQLFIPKTHQAVEGIVSYILANPATLITMPEGTGTDYKEDLMKAKSQNQLLNFVWRKTMNMPSKLEIWGKQVVLFGT
jgi:hypothetical protein